MIPENINCPKLVMDTNCPLKCLIQQFKIECPITVGTIPNAAIQIILFMEYDIKGSVKNNAVMKQIIPAVI